MLAPHLFVMSKIDDIVIYKISFVPFPSFQGNQREKRIYLGTVIFDEVPNAAYINLEALPLSKKIAPSD